MATQPKIAPASAEKKMREKSALYPASPISDCYEFIRQIDSLGGKAVSYASILNLMGLTSPTTRSFLNRIGASKQFGLITTGGSTAQLTDLARSILYPSAGEEETKRLLIDAFGNPPLYAKLIERFRDKAVPPQNQLSNILMNEYRIIKQVKDNAARCFVESAEYLGLLKNGVLCMDAFDSSVQTASQDVNVEEKKPEVATASTETPPAMEDSSRDGYYFEIPTMGKKTARFYIPDGVTDRDIDYIKLYIENMLPVFLDNLKLGL